MSDEINEARIAIAKLDSKIEYIEKSTEELKKVIESLKKEIDLKDNVILKDFKSDLAKVEKRFIDFEKSIHEQGEKTRWAVIKWGATILGAILTAFITKHFIK